LGVAASPLSRLLLAGGGGGRGAEGDGGSTRVVLNALAFGWEEKDKGHDGNQEQGTRTMEQ
jgi:hypothetical protein